MEYESGCSMQQLLRYIAHEYINKIYQSIKKEKKRTKKTSVGYVRKHPRVHLSPSDMNKHEPMNERTNERLNKYQNELVEVKMPLNTTNMNIMV